MKTCLKCQKSKLFIEFSKRSASKDGLQPWCRDCNRLRSRQYYHDNPVKHKAAVRIRTELHRVSAQTQFGEYLLAHPCVDCGEKDLRLLDCDHRGDVPKTMDISRMIRGGYSWAAIQEELAKCDVRCRTCHILKTYERSGHTDWRSKFMQSRGLL